VGTMMENVALEDKNKRVFFTWISGVIFTPRKIFQKISSTSTSIWLTPIIILTCLALFNALVAGRLKTQAVQTGEINYPPDFQYYTPEQQAQYLQAVQSTQGPVFMYVLPAIISIFGVWIGWLIMGGLLHLVTTLFGGRGSTMGSMNIIAWASVPLALRGIIQIIYMLSTKQLINFPGLSGFSPIGEENWILFVNQLLKITDIYIFWQMLLIFLGVRFSTSLSVSKSVISVALTMLIIIFLQAGLSYFSYILGNLSITRPFFF
jgi:hypothetical protein